MEPKKFNLKNDIIFKAFFARKGNEEFLIDFLNALLGIKILKIEIKEEVNLEKLAVTEKGGRLDIQAKLNDDMIANIELQMQDRGNMQIRTSYYAAKIMAREMRIGVPYEEMEKIILINILGYDMFPELKEDYIHKTAIVLDRHRDYTVMDNIEWWFIELSKFRKIRPDMNEKINQWLAFIDDEDKEMISMAEEKNKTLKKAREEMEYLTGDEEVKRLAELREKWDMEYELSMKYARKQGAEDGLRLGKKERIRARQKRADQSKVRKSGLEQGKKQANRETAKKLLKIEMPIEQISEITGLSKEEIEEIEKRLKQ